MSLVPGMISVDSVADILPAYAATPVEWLLRYHNLADPLPSPSGRLRAAYPALLVAPLLYRVEDDRLLQIVDA